MGTAEQTMTASAELVTTFLHRLEAGDIDGAIELLSEDAEWVNVTLPTVRPRARIERVLRALVGRGHFRVHFHNVAVADDGATVLTERTDALGSGRFEQRFWVYGRFELRDGKIAVWRDSFDWWDIAVSLIRAGLGVVVPSLNRRWPGDAGA